MQYDFLQIAEKLKQKNRKKHRWSKVVSALACAVAFCTTYALILPALTIESKENLHPSGDGNLVASDSDAQKEDSAESDRLSEILDRLGGYHKEKAERTKVDADVIYVSSSSNAGTIHVQTESNAQVKSASNAKPGEIRTMVHKGKDYSVTVSFTEEAGFPEDVELKVRELKQGSSEYEEHYKQTEEILPEDQGVLFCRFFDVSFVADGEEIEPEASVDVQITYDEPILKEEGVNCTTVHFAEDGVEVLPAEVLEADDGGDIVAFTQDSFSVVGTAVTTLNLSSGSYIFYKDGYALGVNGTSIQAIPITIDEKGYVYPKNTAVSIDRITWSYSNSSLRNKSAGRYLSFRSEVSLSPYSSAIYARIINNAVRFSLYDNSTSNRYLGFDASLGTYISGALFDKGDYFLAAKLETVDETLIQEGDLSIEDLIKTKGILQPKINSAALAGRTLEYIWYRSDDNGTTWKKVERRRVTGDSYNTAEDGSWLNVALDKGADKDYRVEILSIDGVQADTAAASNAYHVSYYDSVQNGDFEEPKISINTSNAEHYQPFLPNDTAGMVWKTTASDKEIEFISVASYDFKEMSTKWHNCESAANGYQYVELNANMAGALYQDILTIPGSKMFWKLAHRGRGPSNMKNSTAARDTMYVVIMSTVLAEQYDVTTQNAVNDVIKNTSKYPGAEVVAITDDNLKWYYHNGEYSIPTGQYLTRYFFVSGKTAFDTYSPSSGLAGTIGNHLDDIYFSTELPPPDEGKVNLQITKTIVGLDKTAAEELLKNMTFTIGSSPRETIYGSNFGELIGNDDGSFTATYQTTYDIGTAGSITKTITENTAAADVSGYDRKTTVSASGVTLPFTDREASSAAITIRNQGTGVVSFTNTYEKQTTPITLLKVDEKDQPLSGAKFQLEFYDDSSQAWTGVSGEIESGTDGTVTVSDLKYGVRYRLTETTAPDGYYPLTEQIYFKVMMKNNTSIIEILDQDGNTSTKWGEQITSLDTGLGLKIKNYHGMVLPETGGSGAGKSYLFGAILLLGTWFFCRYRRKKLCEGRSKR